MTFRAACPAFLSRSLKIIGLLGCILFLAKPCVRASEVNVTVTTLRRVQPVLIRNDAGALLQIVVEVRRHNDVRLQAMHFTLQDTDDVGDIEALTLYATGDKQELATNAPFGQSSQAQAALTFRGDLALGPGKNVFWLSCRLKPTANLSHKVKAICTAVVTSAGKFPAKDLSPGIRQPIGIALRRMILAKGPVSSEIGPAHPSRTRTIFLLPLRTIRPSLTAT